MRGEILLAIMLIPATMLIPALGVRGDTVYCKYEGYDKETTLAEDVLVTNQLNFVKTFTAGRGSTGLTSVQKRNVTRSSRR
jgi:hypothetical protein